MNRLFRFLLSRKFLILLFLVFLATRVVHLTADPPQDLSWSLGLFFDEGVYNHNARNQILFGEWKLDEWNDYYYSAISTWIKYQVLGIIGIGRAQIRLISIAYSMLSLLFVYLAAKESYSKKTGLISLLLFGTNYVSLMYGRIGMQDTQTLTVFIAAFYFWQAGMSRLNKNEKLWSMHMFLAGVTVFISYTYKNLFLYLLPVPFVALIALFVIHIRNSQKRMQMLKAFGMLSFGALAAFSIWYLTFYRPNQYIISQFGSFFTKQQMFPTTRLSKVLEVIHTNPLFAYFSHTPVILIGAFLTLLVMYVVLFSEKRFVLREADVYLMTWFWAVFLFTTIIAYRPTRYFLPIIPPFCLLTARGLERLSKLNSLQLPKKLSVLIFPIAMLWLAIFFGFGLFPLRFRGIYYAPANLFVPPSRSDLISGLIASCVCLAVLWKIFTMRWRNTIHVPRIVFPALAILLVISSMVFDGRWYYRWFRTARYDVVETGQDIMNHLGEDAYLGGMNAPGVAYDTPYKVLFSWDKFVNYKENPIEKYHLTHLFLGDGAGSDERRYYYRQYPRNMYRATPLQQYMIKGTTYTLFSLIEPRIEILSNRDNFDPNDDIELPLRVTNFDFREPHTLLLNWNLYPLDGPTGIEPLASGETTECLIQPEKQQELSISGYLSNQIGKFLLLVSWQDVKTHTYQAEEAKSQIGEMITDASAAGNKAVFHHVDASSPEEGFTVYGDYHYYPAGVYEAAFRIKVGKNDSTDPILRLDAAGNYGKVVLPELEVKGTDFENTETYHTISFPFLLNTGTSFVEFRVYTYGITDIWVDEIQLTSLEGVWHESPIEIGN